MTHAKQKTEWLLLIHQIPPKPDYFRVKIWRRLQKVGAVAIKQSVYALPDTTQSYEDLHWIVTEIKEGGGTASLSKAVFLEGISDEDIRSLFHAARDEEYEKVAGDARCLIADSTESSTETATVLQKRKKELNRLRNRFSEISGIDFFQATGREEAERLLDQCMNLLSKPEEPQTDTPSKYKDVSAHTWVTRKSIYVDRIACGWLIRRFIDPDSQFKFVSEEGYQPQAGELRFDMFQGEFTHIGDACSFEVLISTFSLDSKPMRAMAEIIHDIDLKDKKYSRPEASGIETIFSGIKASSHSDQERLERGSALLDELYASFTEHK